MDKQKKITAEELSEELLGTVSGGIDVFWGNYDKSHPNPIDNSQGIDNIDVREQAALNIINAWQNQVRMHGDQLSTDAQQMTEKMEQCIQNMNSNLSTCTQTVRAIGDICKTITSNIR